jgi:transposase
MPGPKAKHQIELTEEERQELLKLAASRTQPSGLVVRARIILLAADGLPMSEIGLRLKLTRNTVKKWIRRYKQNPENGLKDLPRDGRPPTFNAFVAIHIVKIACEMPSVRGRSLDRWDCGEIARELVRTGVVLTISDETVRRILETHHIKPWRYHMWLSEKKPRDEQFCLCIRALIDLYFRPLTDEECVLSVDENTSIQARRRIAPLIAAAPDRPVLCEHEYERKGALNLFAAFDTRTGKVYGKCYGRKRQVEFIDFLEYLDAVIDPKIKTIHIVCDNVSVHHGKQVKKWLAAHPRFVLHFTPVHCSWMNQVEQWFGILKRKRLTLPHFESKQDLREKLYLFIEQWNERAHAFQWTEKTKQKLERIISRVEASLKEAAA